MSRYSAVVPLNEIERVEIYLNKSTLPLSKIVAQKEPDLAITGNFYDPNAWRPVCPLKAGGQVVRADPEYAYPALVWDKGPDVRIELVPKYGGHPAANHIANCAGLIGGAAQTMYYGSDVGGRRGRTGWGFCGGALAFLAFPDGGDGMTPEQTRDYVKGLGWSDFILGDGGGKVNYYNRADGIMLQGKAASQNMILVYLKKKGDKPVSKKYKVCLDPGHGVETAGKCAPDGSYREHEFALDLGRRIKALLERCGVDVVMTRTTEHCPTGRSDTNDLNYRVKVSDQFGADLFVSLHSNASGDGRGWTSPTGYGIYTSAGPETAARNVCARKLLARAQAAWIGLWGGGLFHDINLLVTRKVKAPAVLIEHGFHTNLVETALLKSDAYRDKLAEVDARGICDFLGVTWVEETPVKPDEPWYAKDQAWAVDMGIADGTRPDDTCTRAEVWTMLHRVYDLLKK